MNKIKKTGNKIYMYSVTHFYMDLVILNVKIYINNLLKINKFLFI